MDLIWPMFFYYENPLESLHIKWESDEDQVCFLPQLCVADLNILSEESKVFAGLCCDCISLAVSADFLVDGNARILSQHYSG